MSLDKPTVARIAMLARVEVPAEQQERLAGELSQIVDWIEQLGEVDTDGVEPLRSVLPIDSHWQADQVSDGGRPDAILRNAPKTHDGYFVVPKVME
jgi:aspartyl-tRNA(Asn)/glutamyl-tRNA(Gln) amidotransferase subunit C